MRVKKANSENKFFHLLFLPSFLRFYEILRKLKLTQPSYFRYNDRRNETSRRECLGMKKVFMILAVTALGVLAVGCSKAAAGPQNNTAGILQEQMPQDGDEIAVITTNQGEVRMMFYPEEAPKAIENFKTLAKQGYYDGLTFHRVINNFMIQTGDPTGTGAGGESIWGEDFEDEISPKLHFFKGAVAMANRGPNTNGSQFFIVQAPSVNEQALSILKEARDGEEDLKIEIGANKVVSLKEIFTDEVLEYYQTHGGTLELERAFGSPYTIFGQVYEGLDTVDAIAAVKTDKDDRPLEDVIIEKIEFQTYGE